MVSAQTICIQIMTVASMFRQKTANRGKIITAILKNDCYFGRSDWS